jgi:hypothetical protein
MTSVVKILASTFSVPLLPQFLRVEGLGLDGQCKSAPISVISGKNSAFPQTSAFLA